MEVWPLQGAEKQSWVFKVAGGKNITAVPEDSLVQHMQSRKPACTGRDCTGNCKCCVQEFHDAAMSFSDVRLLECRKAFVSTNSERARCDSPPAVLCHFSVACLHDILSSSLEEVVRMPWCMRDLPKTVWSAMPLHLRTTKYTIKLFDSVDSV